MTKPLKLFSWNVNGIRAAVKSGFFEEFLAEVQPDVLGLQEIKISNSAREKAEFDFKIYNEYWHPAQKPGYAGTAVFAKVEPLAIGKGFVAPGKTNGNDEEGRVLTLEFEKFFFVNTYFPNARHDLSRLTLKEDFNDRWLRHVKQLEKIKPVVTCGDFNVAHREIDLARPKENEGEAGFTKEERLGADNFISAGFVDTFRALNPKKIQYSWWSYRGGARSRNVGWRIDYFMVSAKISKNVKKAFILDKISGSDHCPVGIEIDI